MHPRTTTVPTPPHGVRAPRSRFGANPLRGMDRACATRSRIAAGGTHNAYTSSEARVGAFLAFPPQQTTRMSLRRAAGRPSLSTVYDAHEDASSPSLRIGLTTPRGRLSRIRCFGRRLTHSLCQLCTHNSVHGHGHEPLLPLRAAGSR